MTTDSTQTLDRDVDLAFAGVAGQARRLAAGEVSARELAELSLARIEATQDTVNAFRSLRTEAARVEAQAADERRARGETGPLLGIPVAIKDDMDLAGETTAFGCAGDFEPKTEDGEVARRLKAAGAVIVGKTNTPELGQWPFTEGPAFGATRNPWDLARSPGGSSGGSAAAVAGGLVAAAVGSDGAGSVRIPAAWTHLVGLKPQRGRISTWPDADPFGGLTCIGPLTRSVGDAALLLDALSGPTARDVHRPPPPSEPFATAAERRDSGPLRIALSLRIPFSGPPARLDAEVRGAIEGVADALAGLGHHVERADPAYGLIGLDFVPRASGGVRQWVADTPDPDRLDPRTRHAARMGRILGGPVAGLARRLEPAIARRVGRIFERFDVVLTPTTAKPPVPIGAIDGLSDWETDKVMVGACPYAWPWNVVGWPGLNVPAGFTPAGLPVGAQLLGRANDEPRLLALAAQLEGAQAEPWSTRRPPAAGTAASPG